MSFEDKEQSAQDGAPIELYLFEGEGTYAFTDGSVPFELNGVTYKPKSVRRSSPTLSVKVSASDITLTLPFNDDYAARYLNTVPPYPDKVTISTIHLSDPDLEPSVFWRGYVSGVKFDKLTSTVNLSTLSSKMAAQIPKRTFSWSCNHVLYGSTCGVNKADYTVGATVTDVSDDGLTITVVDNDATLGDVLSVRYTADSAYFNGGVIRSPSLVDSRMVLTVDEGTGEYILNLMVPVNSLSEGDLITLTAGCNRSVGDCYSRFDNIDNYGGFPFIPTSNPYASDITSNTNKTKPGVGDTSGNPILIINEVD